MPPPREKKIQLFLLNPPPPKKKIKANTSTSSSQYLFNLYPSQKNNITTLCLFPPKNIKDMAVVTYP